MLKGSKGPTLMSMGFRLFILFCILVVGGICFDRLGSYFKTPAMDALVGAAMEMYLQDNRTPPADLRAIQEELDYVCNERSIIIQRKGKNVFLVVDKSGKHKSVRYLRRERRDEAQYEYVLLHD